MDVIDIGRLTRSWFCPMPFCWRFNFNWLPLHSYPNDNVHRLVFQDKLYIFHPSSRRSSSPGFTSGSVSRGDVRLLALRRKPNCMFSQVWYESPFPDTSRLARDSYAMGNSHNRVASAARPLHRRTQLRGRNLFQKG
jgi:hypothetical protein